MVNIISRNEWGAKPAKSRSNFGILRGACFHWHGSPIPFGSLEDSKQAVRNVQASHFANKAEGYVDIAYNFLYDHLGNIFEGRGWNNRGGANGTSKANANYVSFCYLGGTGQPFTVEAQKAVLELRHEATRRGIGGENKSHSDFFPTQCAGNDIKHFIRNIGNGFVLIPSTPTKTGKPSFPLPQGHWFGLADKNSRNHSGYWSADKDGVRQLQMLLNTHGSGLVVDGDFGVKTDKAVRNFQRASRLVVDGLVRVDTWARL